MNRTPYFLIDATHNITATEVIGEGKTLIEKTSSLTGKLSQMLIGIDFHKFVESFDAWDAGELLQNAFPELDADEREFVKTGITPEEWEAAFGE